MNSEELKAHRRAICEALIDGKQCQIMVCGNWYDQQPETVACRLFSNPTMSEEIRIKPREPRKCWVKFDSGHDCYVKPFCAYTEKEAERYGWQLVVEDVK